MDRRERPWRKLRVVVEVTVPPTNRSTETDLLYAVREAMDYSVPMPRKAHVSPYDAVVRLKTFNAFYPAYRRAEKGIVNVRRFRSRPDRDNGL